MMTTALCTMDHLTVTSNGRVFEFVPGFSTNVEPFRVPGSEQFADSEAEVGDCVNFPFEDKSRPFRPELGDDSFYLGNLCFRRIR